MNSCLILNIWEIGSPYIITGFKCAAGSIEELTIACPLKILSCALF